MLKDTKGIKLREWWNTVEPLKRLNIYYTDYTITYLQRDSDYDYRAKDR